MNRIRNTILQLLVLPALLGFLAGCENNDVEEEGMPYALRQFADQYFQGRDISDYEKLSNGNYKFDISNGPTIVVSLSTEVTKPPMTNLASLISYQGNGETMPQTMAWNFFPPELYNYIDGLEDINKIYSMELKNGVYYVSLFDTDVQYDTVTGTIIET